MFNLTGKQTTVG